MSKHSIIANFCLIAICMAICPAWSAHNFPSKSLPGQSIASNMFYNYENSGVTWNSQLQKLLIVSDNGHLIAMNEDGSDFQTWNVNGDLEAVTCVNFKTPYVYIGIENPDSICEFNILTGRVTRVFDLTNWMDGPSNSGLEALTFVSDESDPEGGLFYAGLQDTGEIYVFRLPIKSSSTKITPSYIRRIGSPYSDISDLFYCQTQNIIYAIYDSADTMVLMQPDGSIIDHWRLPGVNQEGITLKGRDLFIAHDNGSNPSEIIKYSPFQIYQQPDLNSSGDISLADFSILAAQWLSDTYEADVNNNGNVDINDLEIMADFWLS